MVAREEIFGPVASIITFEDEAEAVEIANDTNYGLAAGIWSEDMRQAHRVAEQIEAGTVYVNEYRTLSRASPFGGYKDSGLGRELGREGLEEYQQIKSIWIDLAGEVADPFQIGGADSPRSSRRPNGESRYSQKTFNTRRGQFGYGDHERRMTEPNVPLARNKTHTNGGNTLLR